MITEVIKRDQSVVKFNKEKIILAIFKAASSVGGHDLSLAEELADKVFQQLNMKYSDNTRIDIESIQDMVEKVLIENGKAKTAKAYILYRNTRTKQRELNSNLMKTYKELTFKDAKDNDLKRENANIDTDTAMGTMLKYGSEGAKQFYEMYVLSPEHAEAHKKGDIHIHDLDFLALTTTCCQIDIINLFKNGFSTGHGHLREPNDIASYSALACIAIQSNQNDQHGGQSIPNFDYGMAPGVAKTFIKTYKKNLIKAIRLLTDKDLTIVVEECLEKCASYGIRPSLNGELMKVYFREEPLFLAPHMSEEIIEKVEKFAVEETVKETDKITYQAMEAFIHNLNTMHSRAGAQTPFSSINYGTDTSPEGRMVMKNLLLATEAGLGNGETPIFPIQIFKVKDGINYKEGDLNYDLFKLSCRVSAKRLFPNFSFLDAPYNLKYYKPDHPETEIAYMGCRTRVVGNTYDPSKEIIYGRGNLSFTTINLPRLAINSDKNIEKFFSQLESKIDIVIDQLYERYKIQARKKVKNFPFLMGQGVWIDSEKLGPEDEIGEILKHGTLSIGFIGLAECLKALIGKHHGESEEAQQLGLRIISYMRKRMDAASEKYHMNYSLLATPAEGTSGRFVKLDKKLFGEIPGVTDREYYTNSFHVPVYYKTNAITKINLEAPYHELTNAGHISYVEVDGDPTNNLEAFEKIIKAMKEAGIGYGSINHPVDRDPICGFTGIIEDKCPQCGRTEESGAFERIRRITGYLVGTLDRFNDAKKAEVRDRVKHM